MDSWEPGEVSLVGSPEALVAVLVAVAAVQAPRLRAVSVEARAPVVDLVVRDMAGAIAVVKDVRVAAGSAEVTTALPTVHQNPGARPAVAGPVSLPEPANVVSILVAAEAMDLAMVHR